MTQWTEADRLASRARDRKIKVDTERLQMAFPYLPTQIAKAFAIAEITAFEATRLTDREFLAIRNMGHQRLREFRAIVGPPRARSTAQWVGEAGGTEAHD